MNGAKHYQIAEKLLAAVEGQPAAVGQALAQAAQAHATLAQVALDADVVLGHMSIGQLARNAWNGAIR